MPRRHRRHSTEFKYQAVAEYRGGETLHVLGRRLSCPGAVPEARVSAPSHTSGNHVEV